MTKTPQITLFESGFRILHTLVLR